MKRIKEVKRFEKRMKSFNIQLTSILGREKGVNEEEVIFEEIMTVNFLEMMKYKIYRCRKNSSTQ